MARVMPDVAREAASDVAGQLDWVGMDAIEMPVLVPGSDGTPVQVPARVSAYVNLADAQARGIHMSRLYLHLDRCLTVEPLTPRALRSLVDAFLGSHDGLSDRAMVHIAFEHLIRRPALATDNSGWKRYPVELSAVAEGGKHTIELALSVGYSSTCPCSAALARQVIQERFGEDFDTERALDFDEVQAWLGTEAGISATPHSQRSQAEVRVALAPSFDGFPVTDLIDRLEACLKTPVQAAVKREDEQAFARLNGENLMFCEDAARRIERVLNADARIVDFWARATHYESLHPHNAVSVVTKGVPGGYRSTPHGIDHVGG